MGCNFLFSAPGLPVVNEAAQLRVCDNLAGQVGAAALGPGLGPAEPRPLRVLLDLPVVSESGAQHSPLVSFHRGSGADQVGRVLLCADPHSWRLRAKGTAREPSPVPTEAPA